MIRALLLSSLVLNVGLLLGRLSGFAREAFVAATYGTTAQADIVVLMLTVPDLLVNILVGGALGAVLIPEFTANPDRARKLLYQSMVIIGLIFLVFALFIYVLSGMLVSILAPGFSLLQSVEAATAIGWVIWLMPLTVLAGVTTAYLHSRNKFAVASLGSLIINSSIIAGLLLVYAGYGSLQLVAVFVLLGGLLRLFSQLLSVGPSWHPVSSFRPFHLDKSLLARYGQAMLSGSVLLLFPVAARALASYEGEGSVALFNYAIRLVEFPLAIAVTFVSTALYPRLSASFSTDLLLHKRLVKYGAQITIGLSLVTSIILNIISVTYADIVFGHGNMRSTGIDSIASLAAIGLIALPLQGLSVFLTSIFNARKDTLTPLILNGVGLIFFLISSYFELFGSGLWGLMTGLVVSYGVICTLLLVFVKSESFERKEILLDKGFVIGVITAITLSIYFTRWIEVFVTENWLVMLSACLVGLAALTIMALFNNVVRTNILAWLR